MPDADEFLKHFREILETSDFSDVTIISDDLKIFKGHRNILSVFSPVLKSLFKIESYHSSSLYLNGINSTEINAILKYIYFNTIPLKWTKQLESAVDSLQIKALQDQIPVQYTLPPLPQSEGLDKGKNISEPSIKEESDEDIKINLLDLVLGINDIESKTDEANHEEPIRKDYSEEESSPMVISVSSSENQENIEQITHKGSICVSVPTGANSNMKRSKEGEDVDALKSAQMHASKDMPIAKTKYTKVNLSELVKMTSVKPSLNVSNKMSNTPKAFIDKNAKFTRVNTRTPNPIKIKISPNVSDEIMKIPKASIKRVRKKYKCEMCNHKVFSSKLNLEKHTNIKHLGMREDTPCDQCDYNPKDKRNLFKHKRAEHEGVRFSCHFCEYKTKYQQSLKEHISSIHEEKKTQCAQCGKQFSRPSILSKHMKNVHGGGGRYKCQFCEYHATEKKNLKVHFQKIHKDLHIDVFKEAMKKQKVKSRTPNLFSSLSPQQA